MPVPFAAPNRQTDANRREQTRTDADRRGRTTLATGRGARRLRQGGSGAAQVTATFEADAAGLATWLVTDPVCP